MPNRIEMTTKRIESRRLKDLVQYPSQAAFFDPGSDADFGALKDNVRRQGFQHLIAMIPAKNNARLKPNTIVTGDITKS